MFLRFTVLFLRFMTLVLVSIEKIYQTLKTVFEHVPKHLEGRQKYHATRRIINSLPGVWKWGHGLSCLMYYRNLRCKNTVLERLNQTASFFSFANL